MKSVDAIEIREELLEMAERLLKICNTIRKSELDEEELDINNIVEFMGEDENGNGLYKFK